MTRRCLECIVPLCTQVYKEHLADTQYGYCLRDLFKNFFQLIFSKCVEMELFDMCSNVLYSFICCFQVKPFFSIIKIFYNYERIFKQFNSLIKDTYRVLVSQLIEQINDDNLKMKIMEGFNNLTPVNFTFNMEKRNRIKFSSKFNEFCIKTYGLLFIR